MPGKSQAAMEFLMTYGWAFVVVLVLIGTLVYFGVLDMKVLIPKSCYSSSDMTCIKKPEIENGFNGGAFIMSRITIQLRNNWADNIFLNSINLSGNGIHPCIEITDSGIIRKDGTSSRFSEIPMIKSNEVFTVMIYCSGNMQDIAKENVYIGYTFSDLALLQYNEISLSSRTINVLEPEIQKPW